jgi:hypothetical protein
MSISKRILIICSILASLAAVIDHFVNFEISGHFEGLYLTRHAGTKTYEFSDHLIVGKESKLLFARNLSNSYYRMAKRLFPKLGNQRSHLYAEWNPWDGSGLVSSSFPDGTGLVTYLGRYLDADKEVHGLFVGGGVPETIEQNNNYNMNNSGMTYFDGKRWYHIWCSVNEGIGSAETGVILTPSKWEFIGSGVESRSSEKVIITSKHKVVIDGIPANISRKMHFTAGANYFNLEIRIKNVGSTPLKYIYIYGDEPWVGYYGTSLGDVGWVKDRIVSYEESIDTNKYSYLGMADIGNRIIGEQPRYSNLANFIEWFGPEQPAVAYFTNDMKHLPEADKKVPLESNERFVGLHWERWLKPAESATIRLAIGMAFLNPQTGIPEKPPTTWE